MSYKNVNGFTENDFTKCTPIRKIHRCVFHAIYEILSVLETLNSGLEVQIKVNVDLNNAEAIALTVPRKLKKSLFMSVS